MDPLPILCDCLKIPQYTSIYKYTTKNYLTLLRPRMATTSRSWRLSPRISTPPIPGRNTLRFGWLLPTLRYFPGASNGVYFSLETGVFAGERFLRLLPELLLDHASRCEAG